MMTNPRPRIWGLVRASTNRQKDSEHLQEEKIAEVAAGLEGEYMGCMVDSQTPASKVPLFEREGVRALQALVRPGDYVATWMYDRLSRRMEDTVDLLRWVKSHGLLLIVGDLKGGKEPIDFANFEDRSAVFLRGYVAEAETHIRSKRAKDHHKKRAESGLPINAHVPYGHRKVTVPDKKKRNGVRIIGWAPDEEEMRHLAELHYRRANGHTWYGILTDWLARGMKRSDGSDYGQVYRFHGHGHICGANVAKLKKMWKWYDDYLGKLQEDARKALDEEGAEALPDTAT